MLAEFSAFPLDKGARGLSRFVAQSMKIIEERGLDFEIHAMGTLIEGTSDKVFEVIQKCHEKMISQSDRVVTQIRIDDRKGASGTIKGKVRSVEEHLGKELPKGSD